MVAPVLPSLSLAPLRAIADAGLTDRAVLESATWGQDPVTGGAVITWTARAEMRAQLTPASAGGVNIQADRPTPAGTWELAFDRGTPVDVGERAMVWSGGGVWQGLVVITRVLSPDPDELLRECFAVDVDLSE